jgi:hypothetical protein
VISRVLTLSPLETINAKNVDSYLVAGACESEASQIEISFNAKELIFTGDCQNFQYSENLDLSSLSDGKEIEITVAEAGSFSSERIIKDTQAASINSTEIIAATYALNDTVFLNLTFDESVIVTNTPQIKFNLDTQSQADIVFKYISGSASNKLTFSYSIATGDNDLTGVTLNSEIDFSTGSIADANGNQINTNLSSTEFATVLVDTNIPQIVSLINPVNGTYADGGGELTFQVNFSEPVDITGAPRLSLEIGSSTKYAVYKSGSGSTGIEFSYAIGPLDSDSDGISFASNSIELNSGEIKASGDQNTADVNFSAFATAMELVIVDTDSDITAPDKVVGITTAPTTSNTSLSLAWSTPANNGTAIVNYQMQYRTQGQATWIGLPSATSTTATVSDLIPGTTYEFRIAANNGLLGPYSDISSVQIFDILSLNPIAWLSATNITNGGTEPLNGEKVSTWKDLTGSATDAVESNASKQPTFETNVQNGLPAVKFDGTIDRGLEGSFTRTNNGGLTMFLVGKFSGTARRAFFEFYKTGGGTSPGSPRGFFFTYGFNNASVNYNLDNTQFNVWSAYDTGTNTDFWENGNLVYSNFGNWGNTAFTGSGSYVLGDDQTGGDRLNGHIGELLIFDRELTANERSTIENYLKNKWGTQ